jgi:hypothetical protein
MVLRGVWSMWPQQGVEALQNVCQVVLRTQAGLAGLQGRTFTQACGHWRHPLWSRGHPRDAFSFLHLISGVWRQELEATMEHHTQLHAILADSHRELVRATRQQGDGLGLTVERAMAQWQAPSVVVASMLRTTAQSWTATSEEKTPSRAGLLSGRR